MSGASSDFVVLDSATTQTFDADLILIGGGRDLRMKLNGGTVVFNGQIDLGSNWLFPVLDASAGGTIELNGNNTGDGKGAVIVAGANVSRGLLRNNVDFTQLVLGSPTALGNPDVSYSDRRGCFTNNKSMYVSTSMDLTGANAVQNTLFINAAWIDYNGTFDMDVNGIVVQTGNRDFKVTSSGSVAVGDYGIAMSTRNTADGSNGQLYLNLSGSGGLVVNGPLYDTFHSDGITSTTKTDGAGNLTNSVLRFANGTAELNADSSATFSGDLRIHNGAKVVAGHDNALGATGNGSSTDIDPGGTLDLNGHSVGETFYGLDGNGNGNGAIQNNSATAAGLTADLVNVGSFGVGGSGDIELQNVRKIDSVVDRNLTKYGAGALTLSGALDNTRYGLIVNGGTVNLNKTGALAVVNNPLVINAGTAKITGTGGNQINNADNLEVNGGAFDLNGYNEAVGGLNAAAAGGVVTNNAAATTAILYVGGSTPGTSDGDYAGVIQDGAGTVALTKEGTGAQRLSGVNTYTGDTTVLNGAVLVNSPGQVGTASASVNIGPGTLGGTGKVIGGAGVNILADGILAPGDPSIATGVGTLTVDLTAAPGALSFTGTASGEFVLDAGLASSTVAILGGALPNDVLFDNTVLDFTDNTAGSLSDGAYLLFDGDTLTGYSGLTLSGTDITAGLSVGTGLGAYSTSLSLVGSDIFLNIGSAGTPGDLDGDGDVDVADLMAWQRTDGSSAGLTTWRDNFGTGSALGAAAQAVPEPSAALLIAVAGALLAGRSRYRS